MKMATPSTPTADDEVAALLAQADALVDARKSGGPPEPPKVQWEDVDLLNEVRRSVLFFRPYATFDRPLPTFEEVTAEGALMDGQAQAWRSRDRDPAGPWLALALSPRHAVAGLETDVVGCWRHFWRIWRAELVDGEDWEVQAGSHPAAQEWLRLALQEAVTGRGVVRVFPAHTDAAAVKETQELAHAGRALGYMSAWRRANGEHRRKEPPKRSMPEIYAEAVAAVQEANALFHAAQAAVDVKRAQRAEVRRRRTSERLAQPVATWLHEKGWRQSLALAALDRELRQANDEVQSAKAMEEEARAALGRQQALRDEAGTGWKKALADEANSATKKG